MVEEVTAVTQYRFVATPMLIGCARVVRAVPNVNLQFAQDATSE